MPSPQAEFDWQVRVYYEDTDAGGMVFYANYLRYMERARTEWLRQLGFDHQYLSEHYEVLFVVKNLTINYLSPAHLDEQLTVVSRLLTSRSASLSFAQSINNATGKRISEATVKLACIHAKTLKVTALPAAFVGKITP